MLKIKFLVSLKKISRFIGMKVCTLKDTVIGIQKVCTVKDTINGILLTEDTIDGMKVCTLKHTINGMV